MDNSGVPSFYMAGPELVASAESLWSGKCHYSLVTRLNWKQQQNNNNNQQHCCGVLDGCGVKL